MENKETAVEKPKKEITALELKEIAKKGKEGKFIALVDLNETKAILTELSDKYKDLEVTADNYKKEGAEAEKELRQTRYALQNIHDGNNTFLNNIKKAQKQTYDGLIAIIEPQEERIYKEVNAFKKIEEDKKKEKEEAEKKRIERIEKALKEAEFSLEKALIQGKTQEDLDNYDKFLEELEKSFPTFEEREFEVKRMHAIYTAKRLLLEEQIKKCIEAEKIRQEQEAKDKKRQEQADKIYEIRKTKLIEAGLSFDEKTGVFTAFDKFTYTKEEVKAKDEVEWYELLDYLTKELAEILDQKKKADEKAEKDKLIKARNDWDEAVTIYEGLGGDGKLWRLKKDEIPSEEEVAKLTQAIKDLHAKKRALKLQSVKADLEPYKENALKLVEELENDIKNKEFKNEESINILNNFKSKLNELVGESFGA